MFISIQDYQINMSRVDYYYMSFNKLNNGYDDKWYIQFIFNDNEKTFYFETKEKAEMELNKIQNSSGVKTVI